MLSGSRAAASPSGSPSADRGRDVARVGAAIWVAASQGGDDGFELVRVDPDEGKVSSGSRSATTSRRRSCRSAKDLWVITSGGEAKLVSPG